VPDQTPTTPTSPTTATTPVTPAVTPAGRKLRAADLVPLVGFVVPTVILGYGFVIPRSCIAGVNELTIGFGTSILAACVTYVVGVRQALRR
jgi:hypothetical protein